MTDFLATPASLTSHILFRDGCYLHYWIGGPSGRPLVAFMPGATMDHRMFNAQIEALLPHYRVLTWDARGHGQSQPLGVGFSLGICAQDMLAILDEVQAPQAILCGQSLGGYIAQHLYLTAPQKVQAMIIIGSTPITKAYNKTEIWALKASLALFRLWPYNHLVKTIARNTAHTAPIQAYAHQAAGQIKQDDFLTIWQAVTEAIDDKGLPQKSFDVPLLLLHGESDKTGTIKRDMPLWARQEKEATYQVIPQAGHNANQDNPAFTNQAILDFLQTAVDGVMP